MKRNHCMLYFLIASLSLVACRNQTNQASSTENHSSDSSQTSQEVSPATTSTRSSMTQVGSTSQTTRLNETSRSSESPSAQASSQHSQESPLSSTSPETSQEPPQTQAPTTSQETTSQESLTPPATSGGWADLSLGTLVIVNKQHALPRDYAPGENPQAGQAVRSLIADMQAQGFAISSSYSGFRSYDYQASLYQSYANRDGYALADTYSARPGYSEHQTGLAFDILSSSGSLLGTSPQDSEAVTWLHSHAADYGFILRYPWGKEGVTGYQYEAWHLRYVGDQAGAIAASGLTLEEYFGVAGGGY